MSVNDPLSLGLDAGMGAQILLETGMRAEASALADRAIELYRPLGAHRYLAEAEALHSSEAAATARPG